MIEGRLPQDFWRRRVPEARLDVVVDLAAQVMRIPPESHRLNCQILHRLA